MSKISPDLRKKVDEFKKEGHNVAKLEISGRDYYYRSLSRKEFRDMQETIQTKYATLNLDPNEDVTPDQANQMELIKDDAETEVAMKCVFEPALSSLENLPAGVVPTLVDNIMKVSGFGLEVKPEVL